MRPTRYTDDDSLTAREAAALDEADELREELAHQRAEASRYRAIGAAFGGLAVGLCLHFALSA